jgi:hypothetical protein
VLPQLTRGILTQPSLQRKVTISTILVQAKFVHCPLRIAGRMHWPPLSLVMFTLFAAKLQSSKAPKPQSSKAIQLQSFKPTKLQSYNATRLQRYNATTLQGYNATRLQRYKATTLQGYNATSLQRTRLQR